MTRYAKQTMKKERTDDPVFLDFT